MDFEQLAKIENIVVFGIAWATDHEDGDVRTWLAADPS